ncbi:glycine zipper 2TM domain-containing protein [Janthinobacterium agaricidamnosum]|uniref:Rickettsia 17 kDa surface antigen family protein n=1 Tax=Janthinobacterium agaricidamnosum NBRC 102515 = DSM 9628 TaxID=1349767 RepID=W0V6B6_9BURK|nr:glycine zipper 2TM domain-containing protein [Janthinobacterium agaricidamnosum]CDG84369.1 rickettsia 17 kDa surface antigen family protein [Janthinobacterium agaricidamnosum NBRC 102515 = DSM 9628]
MQDQTPPKSSMHPLLIAAAAAVILFCAVGSAALLGWLPASKGGNPPAGSLTASDRQASAPAPADTANLPLPAPAPLPAQPAPRQLAAAAAPVQRPAAPAYAEPAPERRVCPNCGVVESVREITTRAEGSGIGAAGGAVVGGLLGNQVGGGRGRDVATVLGAIGGAVAGNQVEGNVRAIHSYNVRVRLEDGSSRTVHQSANNWRAGDRVRIVDNDLRANG